MSSDERTFVRIGKYVDGELPAAERDEVECLIADSAEYRDAAEDYRWLDQVAGGGAVPAVSADEWVRVKEGVLRRRDAAAADGERDAALLAAPQVVPMPARRGSRGVLALAALFLFAASLGLGIYLSGPGSSPAGPGGADIGPGQASAGAVEHVEGTRPTTIEVDKDGGPSRVIYEDF